ncbi:MAG: ABC transporter permease, partial [Gemmiger sp.]|nr:ABC transporter permease [Gemmiger sp.]
MQELADGEIEYADAKADAEAELADAKAKIEDAESQLADLETPTWYVWNRDNNVSFHSFRTNVSKVEAIARVFPAFFFLVAALVVSTTMTRMVEEERLQIGTMKALGYSKGTIIQKYMLYALAAALSGTVVGLAAGFTIFPSVVWQA